MKLEEIYEKLKTVDGGADMVSSLQAEITALRNEAKSSRISKDEVLKALGLEGADKDKDKFSEQSKAITELMAALKAKETQPSSVMEMLNKMQEQVKTLSDESMAAKKAAEEAKAKERSIATNNALVNALTKSKAVSPTEIAKMLSGNVVAKEDGSFAYKHNDQELDLEAGVAEYLKANPWAVGVNVPPGGGTTPPAGNGQDAFEQGFLAELGIKK